MSCLIQTSIIVLERQYEHKTTAPTVTILANHVAPMLLCNLLDQTQAQAHTTGFFCMAWQAEKRLEDALAVGRWHTGATVANAQLHRICRLA